MTYDISLFVSFGNKIEKIQQTCKSKSVSHLLLEELDSISFSLATQRSRLPISDHPLLLLPGLLVGARGHCFAAEAGQLRLNILLLLISEKG